MISQINLSLIGWLNGITATLCVIFAGGFGLFMVFQSKKQNIKLLLYGGLMGFFAGMFWLGPMVDFFSVLLTGKNLPSLEMWGILSFIWPGPALVTSMWVGGEVMLTKKNKRILLITAIIVAIVYESILLLDTAAALRDHADPGGRELYDIAFEIGHPAFILLVIMMGMLFVFCGMGALRQGLKTAGAIKKRFIYMSIAFFLFIFVCIVDAFLEIVIATVLVRGLMIFVASLMYLSLKIKVV